MTGLTIVLSPSGGSSTSAATLPAAKPKAGAAASATVLPGKSLVSERCTVRHRLDRIRTAHKTEAEWMTTVARRIGNGTRLNATEKTAVLQYLFATFK